jgi:protein-tyrosine phosphatase
MEKIKVLFVCMGNICRSPTAEGVFTKIVEEAGVEGSFTIDSAGTHAYHIGEQPDPRSQAAARERGIELKHLKARKVAVEDFEQYDYVLAMDSDNVSSLMQICPEDYKDKVKYFLDYAPELSVKSVPDPYYGGRFGFERVLDLVTAAAQGFLSTMRSEGRLL